MRYFVAMALVLTAAVAAGQTGPSAGPATRGAATRPHFTLSKETTRITEPLRSDGRPDYVRVLDESCAKGVTSKSNAMAGLLEVFGTEGNAIPKRTHDKVLKRLGIGEVGKATYQSFEEFFKQAGLTDADLAARLDDLTPTRSKPWGAKEYPQVAGWLAANDGALDEIVKVTGRPHYYWPYVTGDERAPMVAVLMPNLGRLRDVANSLTARAMLRLGQGRSKECQADLLATHRLGRLATQGATVIERLVGVAIEALAAKGDAGMAEHLGTEDAQAYLVELQKLAPMRPMWECLDVSERYSLLDATLVVAHTGIGEIVPGVSGGRPVDPFPSQEDLANIDWDKVLVRMNAELDRQVASCRLPTFAQRKAASEKLDKDAAKLAVAVGGNADGMVLRVAPEFRTTYRSLGAAERTERIGDFIMAVFLPGISRVGEIADRAQEDGDLGALAVALAAYHGAKGSYPEKLDDLAPAYVKAVPKDLFADAPLKYRKEGAGYVLYSIGPNLVDDGGVAGKTPNVGDRVVRVPK